ncbi:MAG: tetratricopeptide repeat protein [Bradymonadia bacterium]
MSARETPAVASGDRFCDMTPTMHLWMIATAQMIGGLMVGGLLSTSSAHAQSPAEAGRAHYKAGRYAEALDAYKQAHATEPAAPHDCVIGLIYTKLRLPHRGQYFMRQCQRRIGDAQRLPPWLPDELKLVEQSLEQSERYGALKIASGATGTRISITPGFEPDEIFRTPVTVWLPYGTHAFDLTFESGVRTTRQLSVDRKGPTRIIFDPLKPNCEEVGCPGEQLCVAQKCVLRTCEYIKCGEGEQCVEGQCSAISSPPRIAEPVEPHDNTFAWTLTGFGGAALVAGGIFGVKAFNGWRDLEDDKNAISGSALEDRQRTIDNQAVLSWALVAMGGLALYWGVSEFDSDDVGPTASWDGEQAIFGWQGRWP